MEWTFIIIGSVLVIYFIVMIPIQYSYISAMKKRRKEANFSQNQLYDNMSFEEQQLHYNLQGNLINLPSTLAAMLIYKIRHS
jgi:hypothetical protein